MNTEKIIDIRCKNCGRKLCEIAEGPSNDDFKRLKIMCIRCKQITEL
jgi:phage FluMu protein Com